MQYSSVKPTTEKMGHFTQKKSYNNYMTRKSPLESAKSYKLGTKKKGIDGNIWIVVETVNKIRRWKLFRKSSKKTSKKKSIVKYAI